MAIKVINPFVTVSSGSDILLKIILELSINMLNISRRVVDSVLIDVFPSNIFQILLLLERYHQNCQAVLAAIGTNGLQH